MVYRLLKQSEKSAATIDALQTKVKLIIYSVYTVTNRQIKLTKLTQLHDTKNKLSCNVLTCYMGRCVTRVSLTIYQLNNFSWYT